MLQKCKDIDKKKQWFQRNSFSPHTANVAMVWVSEKLWERLMSPKDEVGWISHSPNLN